MSRKAPSRAELASLSQHLHASFGGSLIGDVVGRIRLATEIARCLQCSVEEGDAVVSLLMEADLVVKDLAADGVVAWRVVPRPIHD